WNAISAFFAYDTEPTVASEYRVRGTLRAISPEDGSVSDEVNIDTVVNTNAFVPTQYGSYTLTVQTVGKGHFDSSLESEEVTFFYGAMPQIRVENLSWNTNGTLTWSAVQGASYKVVMDNVILGELQASTTFDLHTYMDGADAGEHGVGVVAFDNENRKLPTTSEILSIRKLEDPRVEYVYTQEDGGRFVVYADETVSSFDITARQGTSTFMSSIENPEESNVISFDFAPSGTLMFTVVANPVSGNYYKSFGVTTRNIYKMPDVEVEGLGEVSSPEGNSTRFELRTQSSTLFDSRLNISFEGGETQQIEGYTPGLTTKNVVLDFTEAGVYTFSVTQIPNAASYEYNDREYVVLNSTKSSALSVTKLADFGTVSHSYVSGNSTLTFGVVEGAENYNVSVLDGDVYRRIAVGLYNLDKTNGIVTFNGKIEELFKEYQVDGKVIFKISAHTADDNLALTSFIIKELTELSAPTAIPREDNTDFTYTWNAVDNASSYNVVVYEIDRATYNAGLTDIDVSGLTPTTAATQETSYTFENEGYYLVKVFSVSGDEDNFISSTESLDQLVCVSKQLTLGTVSFGFNGEKYYLLVENLANVDSYSITVEDVTTSNAVSSDSTSTYLLTQDFSDTTQSYDITVVAKANDNVLYLDSDAYTLTVKKLPEITRSDLTIGEWSVTANATYVMQTKTQSLSISASENAKGVKLWETANESNRAGGPEASSATYNIAGKTNVDLSFKYFGSTKNGELFVIENNEVFLDSEVSTLNFSRLATLTDLQYQNGKLLFNNVGTSLTDGYDLTIFCKDANGTISNIVVTIIHDGKVTAKYNNESVQLASTNDFIENDVNAISLDLTSVVELVASTSNVTIANVYNQGVEYGFAIYSIPLSDSASEVLQSQYATLHGDASSNIIKIEKMVAPVISYAIEGENIVFEWEAVSTRTEVASSTTYQMFVNGERFGGQMSGTTTQSYSLSEFDLSTYYAFSLVAENPYYMESNTSNTIRIWKLAPINTLRLLSSETNAVQLEYQLSSTESDFVDYVKVNNTQNTTGKIAIGSLTSVTLQVIGLKDLVSGDVTTSYIDSTAKTWNLQNMSNLAPSDETIRYESNVLSWERFADGTGLTELSYVLMFDDGTNVATYTTTSIQESLTADNTTFYNTIAGLNEGEITISLYARLSTYDVIASGTIYYAERMQLADGNFGVNYYAYAGTRTIKKLTTPVIETVDFSYTGLENATNPNIVLTFSGNYDNSACFAIYLNGELIENANLTKNAGVYTYTLTPSNFNNVIGFGEEATISICALSSTDIPSSMGNVKVRRAALISSVGFEQNASKYNHNLVVRFSEGAKEYTLGGVIAKIVYTANGGTKQTEYRQIPVANVSDSITYDLSSFIASNLAVGGTIKVSVITDSYADNNSKVYFLSCSEYKNSIEYEVLKAVAQADITTLAGGFTIDKDVNSEATTYVVVHNADTYNVQYDSNEDRFYFPYRTTWENSQYNFTVYAVEDGLVQSAPVVIAVTLNRIDPISGVSITRDASDLSAVTMQWTNVSGANGYILRLYDAQDGRVLYETDALTGNAHTTIDLFGENFKKVVQYGEIDGVTSDMDVKIGLSAIGADDSHNDSLEYVFNATIKGNSLRVQDVAVNEYGIVTFNSVANQKYLYRFVDGLGNEIANSNWTQVVADSEQTKIDASFLSSQIVAGAKFNLELIVMGNATASTSDADFILDSPSFTTVSKDLTFEMGSRIDSIGIDIEVEDGLAVVLTKNAVDKLYFGLTADAIVTGEVAEIVPEYVSDIDVTAIYRIGGAELLDLINENFENIPYGSVDLYFWAYRQTETTDSNYVNYAPTVYNLTYVASCGYEKTEKYVKTDGAAYDTDYASSLVFFTKDSGYVLAGLFVRITDEEENTKTIYTTDLTCDYYSGSTKYILNMTKLFEQDSDLVEESGDYSVDFALLQIDTLGNIKISNWMSETESELTFTKLPKVESLRLSAGMLSWTTSADIDLSYYVYLATTVNAGKIGPTYTRYETSTRYFLATDFIGEDGEFYIGVQGVSDVANVIGSTMVFIEKDETPVPVVKNMIKVPLELDGGKLFFDWDQNGDFVQTLLSVTTQTTQAEAKDIVLATYSSPFTFTMKDLTDGTTTIRFRFTSENGSARVSKNVDIQARDLMLSIFETPFGSDIYTSLDKLYSLLNEKESRDIVTNFKKWMESTGSFGIANHKTIFDDYFEKIQQGRYSLEYCLVGGSTTLNSYWHQFENQNGQNVIYVGAETEVKGIQVTTSTSALNHYQVLIKKSSVYNASYEAEGTDNYVVKIYNDVGEATVFSLTRGVDSYSLTLLDDNTYSVTVYETDSTGVVTANGDYLMFYLNHNGGDSVLGQYEEDIEKGTYGMQIYTVGNQFTTSSKSEYFRVTFFGMGEDFGMQNGMFTWTTQDGRNATVVYKKDGIARETVEVLDGSKGMLIFNLEDGGSGLYEYIEFVTVGEVSGNWIAVDSEMYRLEGSTKLESPYITNTLGYVAINDLANKTTLENSYSASSLFTYKIYNDVSTEDTYITITDTRADGEKASTPLFHETGVTGFADNDIDYAYRETEVDASMFYVSSVGSTAEFAYVNEAGDDYYIKTVYGLETDGTPASDPLAISSDFARIKAMMMDQTGEVKILNGKLAWDEVVGRDSLTLNTRTTVVYKIVVDLYKKSNSEYGTEDTILQETKTFYTTKTEFEFPEIEGAEDIPYIKVSVRAMGLSVVSTLPETIDGVVPTEGVNFVSLVEGGYAYDNAKYENSGDTYILLSEGTLLKNIERTAKIDDNSLEVVDGYLRWTYTLEDETGSDYDLFEEYKFSVYTE
ncbi:MAG: hypothetical protein IJ817_02785, partial [Clostridia bacterium]|nr:hypothetical protein [Clostridia bacterium]